MYRRSIKCLTLIFVLVGVAGMLALVSLPFIASAHRQDSRVTEAVLTADNPRMSGPCPLKVVFSGHVTTDGPGTVKYTFTRSDGARGPAFSLEFKEAGTQAVSTTWTLGDATTLPHYEGWQAVQIFTPNEMESSHKAGAFSITCTSKDSDSQPNPNGQPTPGVNPPQLPNGFQTTLPDDQALSSLIGLLREADALTKNDQLRPALTKATEAVARAQKAEKGSKEVTGNLEEASVLLQKIVADDGSEGVDFRDRVTRAQQLINNISASYYKDRAVRVVNGGTPPCSSPLSPVDCNGEPRTSLDPGVPANALRRRFRVTLNGFRVNHQTNQGLLAQWDTVTFYSTAGTVDTSGHQQAFVSDGFYAHRGGSTSTIGTSPENRVQGGGAGPNGGLITGNGFPNNLTPWRRNEPYRGDHTATIPPTDYFEGELIQNTNAAYIIPTIWVAVGPDDMNLAEVHRAQMDHDRARLERIVAGMITRSGSRQLGYSLRPGASMGLGSSMRLPIGVPQKRPIGMEPAGDQFKFIPQVLVLTFDSAEYLSRTNFGSGIGIVPVRYVDPEGFGGDYTLYLQVERLPDE